MHTSSLDTQKPGAAKRLHAQSYNRGAQRSILLPLTPAGCQLDHAAPGSNGCSPTERKTCPRANQPRFPGLAAPQEGNPSWPPRQATSKPPRSAAGPGGEKRCFAKQWEEKEGMGRAFLHLSNHLPIARLPSCICADPCSAGALFVLEPPEAQEENKAPCLLRGPSTSPRSSDNTRSVLLTLASFSRSFRSFRCVSRPSSDVPPRRRVPVPSRAAG